jgi:hypothetical protein
MRMMTIAFLVLTSLMAFSPAQSSFGQETKIWEFSPYEVQIWISHDPAVAVPENLQAQFSERMIVELERVYRAAWNASAAPTPRQLLRSVSRQLPLLTTNELSGNEYVLVVSANSDETKTVRTFQAAADSITSINASTETMAVLQAAAQEHAIGADSTTAKLLSKLVVEPGGDQAIINGLKSEKLSAGLLPRQLATGIDKTRVVPAQFPWQSDTYLKRYDKIFFVNVAMDGDEYTLSVRELDCPMLHFGPLFNDRSLTWDEMPRRASSLIQRAFAPVARVEAAESNAAELRHKAGGLIVDDPEHKNPARISVGDVMYPIIRRDDRNGNPSILQVLNFTYCAVTESDGVKMKANVYAYSGGPGLQGRQNRRTQRMLLRVRPAVENSELQIVVRGYPEKPQSGCFLYSKDFLTDQFKFLGRTDWRGRLQIHAPQEPVHVLPDLVRVQRVAALKEARKAAEESLRQEYDAAVKKAEEEGNPPPKPPDGVAVEAPPIDPATTVRLNQPLMQLYVKSGETVLAKLPFVPGCQRIEMAELLDDTLRLQSEAYVRGFQNEILDLIGLRNLLAARAKIMIKNGKLDPAQQVIDELRALKNFNDMNDQLVKIERMILEQSNSQTVPQTSKSQIDRMFKSTRDVLQKHLQDDPGSDLDDQLRKIRSGTAPAGN